MSKMLSSWKEIALFFGKGVRTVQRWEKTLDLPIHRPPGAASNVVLARMSDLEEWMHRSSMAKVMSVDSGQSDHDSLTRALGLLQREVSKLANNLGYGFNEKDLPRSAEARIEALTAVLRKLSVDSQNSTVRAA